MKTCKHPLPDNHTGVVEIDGDDVILYIKHNSRVFFGLIPIEQRVSHFEVFKLSDLDQDRTSLLEERVIHGRISRYPYRYRNIETFDIKAELERMYETYAARKKRRDEWEKKLNNFTCI
jgi:hypothetical protein